MGPEAKIEKRLRMRIKTEIPGARCLKFVSPGFAGVPDRIILLPGGRTVFVELKRPGEKPQALQEWAQGVLKKLGFPVFGCVDCMEEVERVIRFCKFGGGNRSATCDPGEGEYADAQTLRSAT